MARRENTGHYEKRYPDKEPQKKQSLLMHLNRTRNTKAFRAFASALAVIVVFGTTYSLILPAITVDHESAEEMPGFYLEDEAFNGADYENAYEDEAFNGADYENAYEEDEAFYSEDDVDASEDANDTEDDSYDQEEYVSEGSWDEDELTVQDEHSNDDTWDDEENPDVYDEPDHFVYDETAAYSEDAVEITEDDEEIVEEPSYTYNNTRLETAVPVTTDFLGDVTFRIDYNGEASIPDGSTLHAEEIDTWAETEEERAYKTWRLENLENEAENLLYESDPDWSYHDTVYFDTELTDPEGNVKEPGAQIYLTLYFTNPIYTEKADVVQFHYDEQLDREVAEFLNPVDYGYTEDGGIYAFVLRTDELPTLGVICGDSLQTLYEQDEEEQISEAEEYDENEMLPDDLNESETDVVESETEFVLIEDEIESATEVASTESETESMADPILTESETESMADPILTESETESMAEPVLTESETESAAEPVLTESETESAAEPVLTESETESIAEPVLEIAEVYPAQEFEGSTDKVSVKVYAPEGAFPAGTVMTVKDADDNVINDITEAVSDDSTKVQKVHAVDITFTNKEGNEIEPLVPVRMTIASEKTKKAEDALVVHVSDEGNVEQVEQAVITERNGEAKARLTVEGSGSGDEANTDSGAEPVEGADSGAEAVLDYTVEADAFSVYAIVYTVDFHWEVNGKTYEFSIPGGGFVSFTDLIEVLGISNQEVHENLIGEADTEVADSEAEIPENAEENIANEGAEKKEIDSTIETALKLDGVEVSDATRKFVADVENVKFSSPKLVWVGKVESETTVGGIKESHELKCEYSADLTKEQIEEINAQTVETGDWALISVQPFTSEEILTVTMKDGEVFTIRVTDGQLHTYVISDSGNTYEIIVTYDDTAEIPKDAELKVREIKKTEDRYTKNVEATNKELKAKDESEIKDPVQFDISIVSGGKEVEPKEGSIVKVEVRLAKSLFGEDTSETQNNTSEKEKIRSQTASMNQEREPGLILFNGHAITNEISELTECRVAHIAKDGNAELINKVENSISGEKIIMQFETESFSDYLFDGNTGTGFNNLPSTIYVGDEIYMWNQADYWVTNIGSVVSETKHNNGWRPGGNGTPDSSNFKTVTALSPGKFRIVHRNDWNNGNPYQNYKEITVLPPRTGTTPPSTIDTVNNEDIGLTLNLFDYDLDNYLDDYYNGSAHYDNTCISNFAGHGINSGNALKFWGSGIGNTYGDLNKYDEHGVTSIVNNSLNASGYPTLTNSSGGSGNRDLSYLFTPADGTDKKAYTNVNGLFKKDGDYYVYDSDKNYAWYNPETNSFNVYNGTYYQHSGSENGGYHTTGPKPIGFFPFHKWDSEYDLYVNWNKNLNHHFGMSMSVDFSLPKEPKAVKDSNQQPIVFNFSGDDDLWVFIDGKLAMDIGGIHQPTAGTIDFYNHEVRVQNGDTEDKTKLQLTRDQFNERFANPNGINLYDGKKHTLQVFYIERGGCDSNCRIRFNMTQYGDVEFDKVDADDENTKLAGAVFGLYKDPDCRTPLMEELNDGSSRAFVVETDEHGHAKIEDVPLGDYYLKELHAPEGYPLTIGGETARVQVYLDGSGNVKASVSGVETGAKITNKKPDPMYLGLKKEWQNANGQQIIAPDGVSATFALKRIRKYTIQTEEKIEGQGRPTSHLTVGWLHNNTPHIYEEFDLVAGSTATVSWSLNNGYTGTVGCEVNGTRHTKTPNTNNIYAQAVTMPAAGQTTVFYILDESENGDAIKGINVAGDQFYGNSGGGYIHHFHTLTDTDPDFSEQVTLPLNGNTWEHIFNDLPTFGTGTVNVALEEGGEVKPYDVAFQYSYYIEEVSSTAPDGTTVIYKDIHNNVINSPSDAETYTSGTETIINKVPFGYLKIKKKVTYNGSDQNLTAAQKSKLAGEYKFKIYTKEQCGAEDALQDPDAAADATDKDLIITITIAENGESVSSDAIKLLAGKYWIKEVESSNPAMFPVANPIPVTVTKNHTVTSPVISSLTNNYDENNGPDKIAIDIEKKFQGLDASTQVPSNFQVLLQYTVGGQLKTVTLNKTELATGENGEKITWTDSADGFTWHWKVTNIPSEATNFKIKEENYNNAKGYDWKSAALNDTDITSTVTNYHDLTVTAPAASLSNVTSARRTSDSGQNTEFYLEDGDILLSKLTANQGTLVISKTPLNLAERDAVEKGWPSQGGFKKPPHYFSIDEHPNGFSYGDKKVTFGVKNGKTTVKFTQNASAQEEVFAVVYSSEEARNNANLLNVYEEVPITIDIFKIDKNDSKKKLPGAVFTLRQLADEAPRDNGELTTKPGTLATDSLATNADGKASFGNLTHGYYEVTEKTAPAGYVMTADTTFYFKIENGVVTWLEKGNGKPSSWLEKSNAEMVSFEAAKAAEGGQPATNAAFTVKNEPGVALPHTGGPGSRLFYLLGCLLLCLAAMLTVNRILWRRRRPI